MVVHWFELYVHTCVLVVVVARHCMVANLALDTYGMDE